MRLVVQSEAFANFLMYGWVRDQLVKRQILPNQPAAPRLIQETQETDIIPVAATACTRTVPAEPRSRWRA